MNNNDKKEMCISLLKAETEQEVIDILKEKELWDDPKAWRLYGDRDGNYATIGNQQSRPEAALVEKIINSVDARLMNECLSLNIDPESDNAPPSIRHAVSRFFENREPVGKTGGTVQSWDKSRQREQAQLITLAATGSRKSPCLIVSDCGEGQTPKKMPETFLSIDQNNKLRIRFVQGKFNMGGTGALKFCGKNKLQLIISKRNPNLLNEMELKEDSSKNWGFTIVRRERPKEGAGQVRNSVFRYLAPEKEDFNGKGQMLSFFEDSLPLMPDGNEALSRNIKFGSCLKLYTYDMKGFKSHVLRKDGLLGRLELLLPGIALPVRVHECRNFGGHKGSYDTSLIGLAARLSENIAGNIEPGYPDSVPFTVQGQHMIAQIFAFSSDKAESYRTNEGIVFTINGQTHGIIPKTIFSRSRVKMGRLAKSLIIMVDCTQLTVDAREDLFMNSRDRLSNGELRKSIEEELEEIIRRHPGLRKLREKRRGEEIAEKLDDSKPLEDVINSVLKSSPSLNRLFLLGQRLAKPHPIGGKGKIGGGGEGPNEGDSKFSGRVHPTFFRFFKKRYGDIIYKNCEYKRRCRIKFETDVVNEYFSRDSNPGTYHVEVIEGNLEGYEPDNSLTLHNGIANWSINIDEEKITVGDELTVQCSIFDDTLLDSFVNVAKIKIVQATSGSSGTDNGKRLSRSGTNEKNGNGTSGNTSNGKKGNKGKLEYDIGIKIPEVINVKQDDENWKAHNFDEKTSCKIVEDAVGDVDDEKSVYTFYVNTDNQYLRIDMKEGKEDVSLKEAKFLYGNVLIGLALINSFKDKNSKKIENNDSNVYEETVEDLVDKTTRATGPFLVPMIDYLGSLSSDEISSIAQVGDDE